MSLSQLEIWISVSDALSHDICIKLSQSDIDKVPILLLFKDKVSKGDLILFEEILIIAKTSDEREKRIEPKTCTFKMNNNELTKTETGFYIPEDISGNQILSIIILDNTLQQYLTFINFVIE